MKTKYPEIGPVYEHYNGGRYQVISLAKHTETDETLVIYKSLLFGSIHARPLSMWFQEVDIDGTGTMMPRFIRRY
jgi:hypothetical protein